MDNNQVFNICKYDFINYEQATILSPDRKDIIRYRKEEEPLILYEPNALPSNSLPITYELGIRINSFGFYSWLPSCKNDLALVKEYKIAPNPYTTYIPSSDNDLGSRLCLIIKSILQEHGFLVGVSCTKYNKNTYTYTFMIMFAIYPLNPCPLFIGLEIPEEEIFFILNVETSSVRISSLIDNILKQRKHIQSQKWNNENIL